MLYYFSTNYIRATLFVRIILFIPPSFPFALLSHLPLFLYFLYFPFLDINPLGSILCFFKEKKNFFSLVNFFFFFPILSGRFIHLYYLTLPWSFSSLLSYLEFLRALFKKKNSILLNEYIFYLVKEVDVNLKPFPPLLLVILFPLNFFFLLVCFSLFLSKVWLFSNVFVTYF